MTCTFRHLWTRNLHRCVCVYTGGRRKLAETVLWESPPGANVLLAARHHPVASRLAVFSFVVAFGISMNLGNVPASRGSSNAGLLQTRATRKIQMWRPRCKEDCLQSFWHPSSWFLETADCPISHDSSCVSRPNLRPVIHGSRIWLTLAFARRARTCSLNCRISFLCYCLRIFSCRMYGSRRGVCTHKETCNLQRASVLPCSRSQTEVVAPLRQLSTVLDVESHVLGVLRTLFTKADLGNVSSCADPARLDQE